MLTEFGTSEPLFIAEILLKLQELQNALKQYLCEVDDLKCMCYELCAPTILKFRNLYVWNFGI